jgi:hypothetical protein
VKDNERLKKELESCQKEINLLKTQVQKPAVQSLQFRQYYQQQQLQQWYHKNLPFSPQESRSQENGYLALTEQELAKKPRREVQENKVINENQQPSLQQTLGERRKKLERKRH